MADINIIKEIIQQLPYTHLARELSQDEYGNILGEFDIDTEEERPPLRWKLLILPSYPFRLNGQDSIKFINADLLDYSHIMEGGLLCLHTLSFPNEKQQLIADISHLKEWVEKYYLTDNKDEHYDHLVVNHGRIEKNYYTFQFTDIDYDFNVGDYGRISLSELFQGINKDGYTIHNYCFHVIKSDRVYKSELYHYKWNSQNYLKIHYGLYCFIGEQPAIYGKFIITDYNQLNSYLDDIQLHYIYSTIKRANKKNCINGLFPLFIGYRIPSGANHWQVLMLPARNLPMSGIKVRIPDSKETRWTGKFNEGIIQWAETINSSYDHFFGRGAFDSQLANKKVLLLGVGAIGSMVAVTLTRCGMRNISIFDFDTKHPGNICRSEYNFITGVDLKTHELRSKLISISPYINCNIELNLDQYIKTGVSSPKKKEKIETKLNEYDYIFDCTTDNSLMYCLDKFELKGRVINLSITNHAKELVCAFSPNIRTYVETMYTKILHNDTNDMFYPTGCWNPTFKASYNDIASMVQFAMKHIVKMLIGEERLTSFYLSENDEGLKINRL
jgi:hypothetical protein